MKNRQLFITHFTMIELLAVIAIIAILAGIGVGGYSFAMNKIKISRTEALIAQISTTLDNLKAKHGFYPVSAKSGSTVDTYLYLDLNSSRKNYTGKFLTEEPKGTVNIPEAYMVDYANQVNYPTLKKSSKPVSGSNLRVVVDAWGNPLVYRSPGEKNPGAFDLYSTTQQAGGVEADTDGSNSNSGGGQLPSGGGKLN